MSDNKLQSIISDLMKLYKTPLASNRSGALYNAFSYPTKISPEAIGIFIACHTKVGNTVLDPFSGSGTTGLGAKLCDRPTPYMIKAAKELGLQPVWGNRNAILYELSTLGSFISTVMCNPPNPTQFEKYANDLLSTVEDELKNIYSIIDNEGNEGNIRYTIWSEVLICPNCNNESTFWDGAVSHDPLQISSSFRCPKCDYSNEASQISRATQTSLDHITGKEHISKKRIPVKIYGRTGKRTWSRLANSVDIEDYYNKTAKIQMDSFPDYKINWGVLYRKGYHYGISHLHHLYTSRNAVVFSRLWNKVAEYPDDYQSALKLLLLSYNSTHSTLMTRVVVKKNISDFVITGSQSGVLYISNLPVEKNIFEGVKRKIKTFKQAFELVKDSTSNVTVYNTSSTSLEIPDKSVDYVFTDPPFGDYIPYSEINQVNEAWLGSITDNESEAIVNTAQNKGIDDYKTLMAGVFSEVSRTLTPEGSISLVFHSAKAQIWEALIESYKQAGLHVLASSVLDKIQSSFKQINSEIKVQGDPLLLLKKVNDDFKTKRIKYNPDLIGNILENAFVHSDNLDEQKPERLYSRYINECILQGETVELDAGQFYEIIKEKLHIYQISQ